jgi:hypothetical protein
MIESALPRVEIFITFGHIVHLGLSPPSQYHQYHILREIANQVLLFLPYAMKCGTLLNQKDPNFEERNTEIGSETNIY